MNPSDNGQVPRKRLLSYDFGLPSQVHSELPLLPLSHHRRLSGNIQQFLLLLLNGFIYINLQILSVQLRELYQHIQALVNIYIISFVNHLIFFVSAVQLMLIQIIIILTSQIQTVKILSGNSSIELS